jgi:hypothetical protein
VFIPGGVDSAKALAEEAMAVLLVNEVYKHCTALAVTGAPPRAWRQCRGEKRRREDRPLWTKASIMGGDGAVGKVGAEFIRAITRHRAWSRESAGQRVPV